MGTAGSTIARRVLGRQLQALRKKSGLSQYNVANVLGISSQTMARLEDGIAGPSASDLYMNALCDHYHVCDDTRRTILALAQDVRVTKRKGGGWCLAHLDRRDDGIDPYACLRDTMKRSTSWSLLLLPRLVQTPDYLRAVAWTETPHAATAEIEERIAGALKHQQRLHDPNFSAEILVSEAALREEWGGPAVMAEQRRYLVEIGQRPNVSIRVVPFNARSRIGALAGPFSLLEFPLTPHSKFVEPPLIYIEEYVGNLYLERSAEVSRYLDVITELRRVALSESDSAVRSLAISDE
ncbi:helix-turn-helix domain-containing protein [Nocardia sp. NPDC003482]